MPKTYNLTDSQILQIARLCVQEQGSLDGVKAEASIMANLLELHYQKKYGDDIYSFVRNSGWFSKAAYWMDNGSAGSASVSAVIDVLCNGNRVLPTYIDEHDCKSDIVTATNNGVPIDKYDNSKYIPHVTRIKNRYGSWYTFYCFPASGSDPFGYTGEPIEAEVDDNCVYVKVE